MVDKKHKGTQKDQGVNLYHIKFREKRCEEDGIHQVEQTVMDAKEEGGNQLCFFGGFNQSVIDGEICCGKIF